MVKQLAQHKYPVLRSKLARNYQNPAGDLLEEIQEQELKSQVGGALWTITPAIPVIISQFKDCGRVYTISAECNGNGKSCG